MRREVNFAIRGVVVVECGSVRWGGAPGTFRSPRCLGALGALVGRRGMVGVISRVSGREGTSVVRRRGSYVRARPPSLPPFSSTRSTYKVLEGGIRKRFPCFSFSYGPFLLTLLLRHPGAD